jgi:hypothetical protein
MAKYSQEFLTQVLAADEFDVLEVEFIARSAKTVAGAGSVIHDCQVETTKLGDDIQDKLNKAKRPANDRWRLICLDSSEGTMKAQVRMQDAIGDITEALAKRVKRV